MRPNTNLSVLSLENDILNTPGSPDDVKTSTTEKAPIFAAIVAEEETEEGREIFDETTTGKERDHVVTKKTRPRVRDTCFSKEKDHVITETLAHV